MWCTRAGLCSVKAVFACKHWGSTAPLHCSEKCSVITGISCCILVPSVGRRWGNANSWMRLSLARCSGQSSHVGCGEDEGLDTAAPRGECQEEASPEPTCAGSAPQPAHAGSLGRPGLPVPGRHLHPLFPLFPLSVLFFLNTTCGNQLVLEGRVLPLVSFWLETYLSPRVLCSYTWQRGVCSAVHSLANLAS